jgi:hypothetical protein
MTARGRDTPIRRCSFGLSGCAGPRPTLTAIDLIVHPRPERPRGSRIGDRSARCPTGPARGRPPAPGSSKPSRRLSDRPIGGTLPQLLEIATDAPRPLEIRGADRLDARRTCAEGVPEPFRRRTAQAGLKQQPGIAEDVIRGHQRLTRREDGGRALVLSNTGVRSRVKRGAIDEGAQRRG